MSITVVEASEFNALEVDPIEARKMIERRRKHKATYLEAMPVQLLMVGAASAAHVEELRAEIERLRVEVEELRAADRAVWRRPALALVRGSKP